MRIGSWVILINVLALVSPMPRKHRVADYSHIPRLLHAPDPPNPDCSVAGGQGGWIHPLYFMCPKAMYGSSECCHCIWVKDFLRRLRKVHRIWQEYQEFIRRYQWPNRKTRPRQPPDFDEATYRVPMEADYTQRVDGEDGEWVKVAFICRVTLSDEEYLRYFPPDRMYRTKPFIARLPKLTRIYKFFCRPDEIFKSVEFSSRRQYELKSRDGRIRSTTNLGVCVAKDRQKQVVMTARFPGDPRKFDESLDHRLFEDPSDFIAPMSIDKEDHDQSNLHWSNKRKRVVTELAWGGKSKRSRRKIYDPTSIACAEVPFGDYLGQKARILGQVQISQAANLHTPSDEELNEISEHDLDEVLSEISEHDFAIVEDEYPSIVEEAMTGTFDDTHSTSESEMPGPAGYRSIAYINLVAASRSEHGLPTTQFLGSSDPDFPHHLLATFYPGDSSTYAPGVSDPTINLHWGALKLRRDSRMQICASPTHRFQGASFELRAEIIPSSDDDF